MKISIRIPIHHDAILWDKVNSVNVAFQDHLNKTYQLPHGLVDCTFVEVPEETTDKHIVFVPNVTGRGPLIPHGVGGKVPIEIGHSRSGYAYHAIVIDGSEIRHDTQVTKDTFDHILGNFISSDAKKLIFFAREVHNAMKELSVLSETLEAKYGQDAEIVKANLQLIDSLNKEELHYKAGKDAAAIIEEFKDTCIRKINGVKNQYNTHRDNSIKQFLGSIVDAFCDFFAKLLLPVGQYEKRKSAVTFFSVEGQPNSMRLTRSANALYQFKSSLEQAADVSLRSSGDFTL